MNDEAYQGQLEKINEQYQRIYKLLDERLMKQIDPFISAYDKDIKMLEQLYILNVQNIKSTEDKLSLLETLNKEKNDRYLKLLSDCSQYTQAAQEKLKELNKKLRLANEYILLKAGGIVYL